MVGATIRHHSFENNCKISLTVLTKHEKAKESNNPAQIDPVYQDSDKVGAQSFAPLSH